MGREANTNAAEPSWEGTYVTLQLSMARDLGLRGAGLMAFAIIHGFAQAKGWCTVPLSYMRWWAGCSKQTAVRAVASLEDAGLITKGRARDNSRSIRTYHLTQRAKNPPRVEDGPEWPGSHNATVTLYGFMVSKLGLTGTELIVYAIVCELCQLGEPAEVPLAYFSSWTGASASTVRRAIRKLEARGLVTAETLKSETGASYNRYTLGPEAMTPKDLIALGIEVAKPKAAAAKEAEPKKGADDPIERQFQDLRGHVPTTAGFGYGLEEYRKIIGDGFTHEDVVKAADEHTDIWLREHPNTSRKYAPRCERTLREIHQELRARPRQRAVPEGPLPDDALIKAALGGNPNGTLYQEALDLVERGMAAHGTPQDRDQIRGETHEWCEAHRAELETLAGSQG